MEKFQKAIDLADHPEKYTEDEIRSLLEDKEIRETYNALCEADSALNLPGNLTSEEIEREWERLNKGMKSKNRKGFRLVGLFSKRVAIVAVVITISLVAMGIGSVILMSHEAPKELSSVGGANTEKEIQNVPSIAADTVVEEKIEQLELEVKVFENETLSNILDEMSRHYRFKVRVLNSNTTGLRLYFRWDPAEELPEVIKQLNNFERINLVLSEDILTVR